MNIHSFRLATAAMLAALALPTASPAQSISPAPPSSAPGPAAASTWGDDPTVHEVFSHDLANECEYRAEVRGTLRPAPLRVSKTHRGYIDETPRFDARLRVRPELHCPGVAAVRGPERAVRGNALTEQELTRSLASRGTLRVAGRGAGEKAQACVYEPEFAMRGGKPAGRDVRYQCQQPRR